MVMVVGHTNTKTQVKNVKGGGCYSEFVIHMNAQADQTQGVHSDASFDAKWAAAQTCA